MKIHDNLDPDVGVNTPPTLMTALNTVKLFQKSLKEEQVRRTTDLLFDIDVNRDLCKWASHSVMDIASLGEVFRHVDTDAGPSSDEFGDMVTDARDTLVVETATAVVAAWAHAHRYYRLRYFGSGIFWGLVATGWFFQVL